MASLTRERVIGAARSSVEQNGYEQLSLRAIARELGVTAPALYDHVASRDQLLRTVADAGYQELVGAFEVDGGTAIERCRARAILYVRFAQTNPEMFRLMFAYRPSAIAIEADNELATASAAFDAATADIEAAIADGDLAGPDPLKTSLTLWAAMHGVATISLVVPTLADDLVDDVVDAMLVGLAPRP